MGFIDDPVWQALDAMRIEPEGASLTFTRRLARENGWSAAYASAVVREYRRFLYLAATGSTPVTPSEQVDQAWHLHLAYTRHYWGELCAAIIGRPLHHGPTAGGGAEGRKFRSLYTQTLARYRDTFGSEPPSDIWPPTEQRFATQYQWVDRSRNFVVPRRTASIAALAGGAALLAACSVLAADTAGAGGASLADSFFHGVLASDLGFFALLVPLFFVLVVTVNIISYLRRKGGQKARRRNARRRDGDSSSGSDYSSDGWSGGGSSATAAGGAAFVAGGGDFGGGGAEGDWDSGGDSGGSDSGGGDSGGGDSGCSGCGGGCGGGD